MDDGEPAPGGPADSEAVRRIAAPVAALAELWARAAAAASPRLSAHQLRALSVVAEGTGTNITGLAGATGVALSSASRLCDRLEAAGLLERAVIPGNRRETAVRVTSQGRALLNAVETRRHHDLAALLGHLPPATVRRLTEDLTALHDAAQDGS